MKKLMIIGAGGHAKVALDIALLMNKWGEIQFLDDNKSGEIFGYEIVGTIKESINFIDTHDFFIAIGDNNLRSSIYKKIYLQNFSIVSLIHPGSTISQFSYIGEGTIVMAGSIINSGTKIGNGSIVNTNSSIDHDCSIGDFVHISPGVSIGGTTKIGSGTRIGIGASVKNNIHILENVVLGAGACVVSNIKKPGIYIGVPAKLKG